MGRRRDMARCNRRLDSFREKYGWLIPVKPGEARARLRDERSWQTSEEASVA